MFVNANETDVYKRQLQASRIIYDARVHLTRLFGGTDPSRLIFTGNSTESLNLVIHGLFVPGDHVITTELEHNSVLRPLYAQQEEGVALTVAVSGRNGTVDFSEIEKAIRPETKAIVCTHASNLTGNVTDLERMGKLAKAYGLLLVVDASQTAGVLDIDVEKMQIDVLCFTGHKSLMGPPVSYTHLPVENYKDEIIQETLKYIEIQYRTARPVSYTHLRLRRRHIRTIHFGVGSKK